MVDALSSSLAPAEVAIVNLSGQKAGILNSCVAQQLEKLLALLALVGPNESSLLRPPPCTQVFKRGAAELELLGVFNSGGFFGRPIKATITEVRKALSEIDRHGKSEEGGHGQILLSEYSALPNSVSARRDFWRKYFDLAKSRGLTSVSMLHRGSGVQHQLLAKILRGEHKPYPYTVSRICHYLAIFLEPSSDQ